MTTETDKAFSNDDSGSAQTETTNDLSDAPIFDYLVYLSPDADRIPVRDSNATFMCGINHSHTQPVEIQAGVSGFLNVGIRLYERESSQLVFEQRLFHTPAAISPHTWTHGKIEIPSKCIKYDETYIMIIDFLNEHRYWFEEKSHKSHRKVVSFYDMSQLTLAERLRAVEDMVFSLSCEMTTHVKIVEDSITRVNGILASIEQFAQHVPQLLNAISTANAAARIVGTSLSSGQTNSFQAKISRLEQDVASLRGLVHSQGRERTPPKSRASRISRK